MDIIMNGLAQGGVASKLLANGMNTAALRTWIGKNGKCYMNRNGKAVQVANATLRKDEWKQYDTAIIEAAQQRLVGVADLISRGLRYAIGNGLGKTVLEYEDESDVTGAQLSMDGLTRGQNDRPEFGIKYLPLPVIHKDFTINARVLAASRETGQPLDTNMAMKSSHKVADRLEEILFTGAGSYSFGGGTLYGYQDFPQRNTGSLSADWSAATGAQIVADVLAMKQSLIDDRYYGPFVIYIPTNAETNLDEDYTSGYPKTIRQRVLEISQIADIKVADHMTAASVLMVQMSSDVVRIVDGMSTQTIQWGVEGDMAFNFKVMAIQVPQIRAAQDGKCGVAHYSV